MTVRQVLENALTDINKVGAPSLLREDFIYLLNKAITDYVNERYTLYLETQQLTDDLRVLTQPAVVNTFTINPNSVFTASYTGVLPQDYLHLLNCSVEFEYNEDYKPTCLIKDSDKFKGVKKMTSKMYSGLIDNYYQKPSNRNPYYYLRNNTDPVIDTDGKRVGGDRDGNASAVNIEIIYGNNTNKYVIKRALIDYLRVPKYISITEEEVEADTDTSQVMEFPYYVCLEIIKKLVVSLLENASDNLRLQTHMGINQSIPVQTGQSNGRSR